MTSPEQIDTASEEGWRLCVQAFDDGAVLEKRCLPGDGDWQHSRNHPRNWDNQGFVRRIKPVRVPKPWDLWKHEGATGLITKESNTSFILLFSNGHEIAVRKDSLTVYVGKVDSKALFEGLLS